jgi:hypothetical protein
MKLPTELQVMGQIVSIEYVDDLEAGDESLMGECDDQYNVIRVCSSKNKNEKEIISAITHELVHFVLAKCGISVLLGDNEESIAISIEENLLPLFNFNKRKWRKKEEIQLGSENRD